MVSPDKPMPSYQNQAMLKHSLRNRLASICFNDGCLFLGGAFMALLLLWSFTSFIYPNNPNQNPATGRLTSGSTSSKCSSENESPHGHGPFNLRYDPPDPNFYDDPGMSYTLEKPVKDWDQKRKDWLRQHPTFAAGADERVLIVTGSQPTPCKNPIGDHLLLRFFKNKVDYARIHGYDVFYNNVLLDPKMFAYWAKYPIVRAAMLAHPECEWIWWIDSDAMFTDMEFKLPLDRYRSHNLVVHGWPHLVYEKKSWTSLNAGVFLIRNCQWSMDFMDLWASTGPQTPDYDKWGQILRSTFKDKLFPVSDDQSALIYLLLHHKDDNKIYLENHYYFESYWVETVATLDNVTEEHTRLEQGVRALRRRHAEKVSEYYGAVREHEQEQQIKGKWRRRPFITHFTGCEPCSGDHNSMYSGESCWNGMVRALNFADNQVLRRYGYVHPDLLDSSKVTPLPFDYPYPIPDQQQEEEEEEQRS